MKILVEIELDLDDSNRKYSPEVLRQIIHDHLLNFAALSHSRASLTYNLHSPQLSACEREGRDKMAQHHDLWADICYEGQLSVKILDEPL